MPKSKTVSKKVQLTVIFEKYERYGSGGIKTKVYKGATEVDCLRRILDVHGYGYYEDDMGKWGRKKLMEEINGQNGDGCDLIIAMFVGSPTLYKGFKPLDSDQCDDRNEND